MINKIKTIRGVVALAVLPVLLLVSGVAFASSSNQVVTISAAAQVKYPVSIEISSDKNSALPDGQDPIGAQVLVSDSLGNPINGVAIRLSGSGKESIAPNQSVTDSSGVAQFTLRSSVAHSVAFQIKIQNPTTKEIYSSNVLALQFKDASDLEKISAGLMGFKDSQSTKDIAQKVITPLTVAGFLFSIYSLIVSALGSFFPFLTYVINILLQYLGIRRKPKKWGVVYDTMNKKPLSLSIVRVFDSKSGSLIQTAVTDMRGVFGFNPIKGGFHIKATKSGYKFPSALLKGISVDGVYNSLYFGEKFISDGKKSIAYSIPLDLNTAVRAEISFWDRIKSISVLSSKTILFIGLLFSIFCLWTNMNWFNAIVVIVYAITLIFRSKSPETHSEPWGYVFDSKTKRPLIGIPVKILDSKYGKVLETKISDEKGRIFMLLPKGGYVLKTNSFVYRIAKNAKNFDGFDNYKGQTFKVEDNQILRFNIPMEKIGKK